MISNKEKQIFVRNIIDCSIKKWYIYFAACRKLRKVDFLWINLSVLPFLQELAENTGGNKGNTGFEVRKTAMQETGHFLRRRLFRGARRAGARGSRWERRARRRQGADGRTRASVCAASSRDSPPRCGRPRARRRRAERPDRAREKWPARTGRRSPAAPPQRAGWYPLPWKTPLSR